MAGQKQIPFAVLVFLGTLYLVQATPLSIEEDFSSCVIVNVPGNSRLDCLGGAWTSTLDEINKRTGGVAVGFGSEVTRTYTFGSLAFTPSSVKVTVSTAGNFVGADTCKFGLRNADGDTYFFDEVSDEFLLSEDRTDVNTRFSFTGSSHFVSFQSVRSITVVLVTIQEAPRFRERCVFDDIRIDGTTVPITPAPSGSPTSSPTVSPSATPTISPSLSPITPTPEPISTSQPTPVTSAPSTLTIGSGSSSPSTTNAEGGEAQSIGLVAGIVAGGVSLAFFVVFIRRRRGATVKEAKADDKGFMGPPSGGEIAALGRGFKGKESEEGSQAISQEDQKLAEELLAPSTTFMEAMTAEKQAGRTVEFGAYTPKGKRERAERNALGPSANYLEHTERSHRKSMFRPSSGFLGQYVRRSRSAKKKKEPGDENLEI